MKQARIDGVNLCRRRFDFAALIVMSSLSSFAAFPFLLSPEEKFDRWMTAWTENARTNMAEETTARFRDEVVVPFVKREMPNPFSEGGRLADRPWAKKAEQVYEKGLRDICGGLFSPWYLDHRNCRMAGDLFEAGCREPFIVMLSAYDSRLGWHLNSNISLERMSAAEHSAPDGKDTPFVQMLRRYFERGLCAASEEAVKESFVRWIRSGTFSADDEIALYNLCKSLFSDCVAEVFEGFDFLRWSYMLEIARKTHYEAIDVAGRGIPSSVSTKGWNMLADRRRAAFDILDEVDQLRPGRVEALSFRLYLDGDSRMGDRKFRERLFREISDRRLDNDRAIRSFVWFNLFPRWGGDPGRRMMRRFAKACYATGRHDTAIPYFYAETMCRYVRDAAIDPFEYFHGHPVVADKCIDVCMRQATNELASGYVRLRAPFVGAAVAYYAGRYEKAAEFAPYLYWVPPELDELFLDKRRIQHAVSAFNDGDHSNVCVRLQRMYDDGRYKGLLDEVASLPKDVYDNYSAKQHICTLVANARMKTDFMEGRDVKGEILSQFPAWWDVGWWRVNDRTWQTYHAFCWEDHVTWRAGIPRDHELELVLSPKPKTSGRHVLVVSRCVYEETHHLPINGIPFVIFIWEKSRTGVYVENNYYKMFSVDPGKAKWIPAKGDRRQVRIACDGGRLDIYVDGGDKPVVSTHEYSDAITLSPETGWARFHGENVRISDIVVRKVLGTDP